MDTRSEIIQIGDNLLREKGYNAFSFSDISKQLNIRNASVHYHFPTKTQLGIAIIREQQHQLAALQERTALATPVEKLEAFLSIYDKAEAEEKVCIVGALATDLFTVEPALQEELKVLVTGILDWITAILTEGRQSGDFHFSTDARTKALMIITNMLASVQLVRVTSPQDFRQIRQTVINELIQHQ